MDLEDESAGVGRVAEGPVEPSVRRVLSPPGRSNGLSPVRVGRVGAVRGVISPSGVRGFHALWEHVLSSFGFNLHAVALKSGGLFPEPFPAEAIPQGWSAEAAGNR
jgi:hypothetical protein